MLTTEWVRVTLRFPSGGIGKGILGVEWYENMKQGSGEQCGIWCHWITGPGERTWGVLEDEAGKVSGVRSCKVLPMKFFKIIS